MHEPQGHRRRKGTLRSAWNIARPDGLIELIGEHHGLLQGLIEACLKTQYPDDFARVIEITYRFSYGWRRIHNPDSGEDVADDLTTTEFTMAMLACRGWTNAEIARHMGVSPGTVKNRYSRIRKAWHRHTRRAGRAYVALATGLPSASNAFRNPALRSINWTFDLEWHPTATGAFVAKLDNLPPVT